MCCLPPLCLLAGQGVIRTVGTEIDRLESELKVGAGAAGGSCVLHL